MSEKFFDVGKVGVFCDAIAHSTERRKDAEDKVVVLTCRVQPFDAKLATAVNPILKADIFRMDSGEPKPEIRRVNFALGIVRQMMTIFATPDTVKASIAFDHVKISDLYARTDGKMRGYVLIFKATFGPLSGQELAFVEDWRNFQRFVTFKAAAASDLFTDPEDPEEDDEDDDAQGDLPGVKDPEFETDEKGRPVEGEAEGEPEPARQRLLSHAGGKKKAAKKKK